MEPQDIIALLDPLREPAPVSWWPPAPGWWALAVSLLIAVGLLLQYAIARHRRRAPLRAAQRELQALRDSSCAPEAGAARLAALVRQVALAKAGNSAERAHAARLTGNDWALYLNALIDDNNHAFSPAFVELAYRQQINADELHEAVALSDQWLRSLGARW